jgi:hypothetical protein
VMSLRKTTNGLRGSMPIQEMMTRTKMAAIRMKVRI